MCPWVNTIPLCYLMSQKALVEGRWLSSTMFEISSILTLASAIFSLASPALVDRRSFQVGDGVNYTVVDHAAAGATLSFVTNSGVCETTPGVNQYSGYLSVGKNMVSNSSLCRVAPYELFSEYVVLVLRSPKQPFNRTSRYVAEWRSRLQ